MASNLRGIFITNPHDLDSTIPGGVQICSREFLKIIQNAGIDIKIFEVEVSQKWTYRFLRALRLDAYHLYDTQAYADALYEVIENFQATYIFINKSELVKFAWLIGRKFGKRVQIIIMSHGNETYDFLHEMSGEFSQMGRLTIIRESLRMGLNLYAESYYRLRYVDLVCAMSHEEVAIEKWLGARKVLFIPRLVESETLPWVPDFQYVGYVGTLSHTPNLIALQATLEELAKLPTCSLRLRLVGGPTAIGERLAGNYAFVDYLGKLSEEELVAEVRQWTFFLNPIFWYSRGASMKLAKAISWGLPIITTQAGRRGYYWHSGELLETPNDAESFVRTLVEELVFKQRAPYWQEQTLQVQKSSPTLDDLSQALVEKLQVSTKKIAETPTREIEIA